MTKYTFIIFGAGPIGLSVAILLHNAGVSKEKMVIYDKRAENYTREGHIIQQTYQFIKDKIGLNLPPKRIYHIKEIERALHEKARELGISIIKKSFCGFTDDTLCTVKVSNDLNEEEFLESEYILDCTGPSRRILMAVNQYFPSSFKPEIFAQSPTPNRLHAYIRMKAGVLSTINNSNLKCEEPIDFARNMLYLKENFNWTFFTYPTVTGVPFGKGKVGAYITLPNEISTNLNVDHWLNTVLTCYQAKKNSVEPLFEYLPPSRTYPLKKKINIFTVNYSVLYHSTFQKKGSPTIIGCGDAQITPRYEQGNGIVLGILRLEELIRSMKITDDCLIEFNAENYHNRVIPLLMQQINKINHLVAQEEIYKPEDLMMVKRKLEFAMEETDIDAEKIKIRNFIKEVNLYCESHFRQGTEKIKLSPASSSHNLFLGNSPRQSERLGMTSGVTFFKEYQKNSQPIDSQITLQN